MATCSRENMVIYSIYFVASWVLSDLLLQMIGRERYLVMSIRNHSVVSSNLHTLSFIVLCYKRDKK